MNVSPSKPFGEDWIELEDSGFVGLVGPFYCKKQEADRLSFRFPTAEKHSNRTGVCQGGALFTFADRALGMAVRARTGDQRTATLQLDIHFIDAVRLGEVVEISPVVLRASKYVVFVNGELKVGDKIVATVNGVWKRLAS